MNFRLSTTCSKTIAALYFYLKRLFVSLIIVPSVFAFAGFALVSNFSFHGMGAQLAQFAADHGTGDPNTIRQTRCVDLVSRNAHPTPVCHTWANEETSVKSFGDELGRAILLIYWIIAFPATLYFASRAADSPLALRRRISAWINAWTERQNRLWQERRRQRAHHK